MSTKALLFLLLVTLPLALTGCGKSETASNAAQQAAGSVQTNAAGEAVLPEPPPPPPSPAINARAENAVQQKVVGEVDPFLTAELRNFIQQKQRMPATFAEFAGLRLDTIPRPPPGKKWVIDTETLEVKAVSAQ